MKTVKKLLTIWLVVCMCFGFVGCSFSFKDHPLPDYRFTYGDFRCCYVTSATSNMAVKKEDAVGVNVLEFVGDRKKWERVVIPETIDGLPVISIGMAGIGWRDTLEGYFDKIYVPVTLQHFCPYNIFWNRTIFLMDKKDDELMENRKIFINRCLDATWGAKFVVFESMYDWYQEFVPESSSLVIANLTYIVDGVEYWMDDCADGESIVFPDDPIKEGFIFGGWYKDNSYIEKWNIETDKYIKNEDLASVKLYGKFVGNLDF